MIRHRPQKRNTINQVQHQQKIRKNQRRKGEKTIMKTLLPSEKSLIEQDQTASHWDLLYDAKDRNTIIPATIIAVKSQQNLSGLIWEVKFDDIPNIRGLIPASETGLPNERWMNFFVGKEINIRIKGIRKKENLVAATRREITEEAQERMLRIATEDQEFEARVIFVSETVLGVDIGGGIIKTFKLTEAKTSQAMKLNELYQEDQYIKVKINEINKPTKKISISLIDPWYHTKYSRGDVVTGTVIKLGLGNIFVTLKPGIVGIVSYPVHAPKPELGSQLICKVVTFVTDTKNLKLDLFDPEIIRGKRKNKKYSKNRKTSETTQLKIVE